MNQQYSMVSDALQWLVEHRHQQPSLADLATHVGQSEMHVQRVFQDYAGVTPKQFLKHLTSQQAKQRLMNGSTVLDATLDCGLSGPGRLHDLLVSTDAITPGEARRRGAGVDLEYGVGDTPFGPALLAWTARGISFLGFTRVNGVDDNIRQLRGQWPDARLIVSNDKAAERLEQIFSGAGDLPTRVWLRGSPFQLKVWEALLRIPPGVHCTYGQIAAFVGKPAASRAVGTAIGRNPVSWLIPCHRVITSSATLGGYRWGTDIKQAMMGWEAASATIKT